MNIVTLELFCKMQGRINFVPWALYISFETCYEVTSEQLFSSSIHKYNISMLLRLSDFVHQFSECGLIFAICKRNYVYSQKYLFLVLIGIYYVLTISAFLTLAAVCIRWWICLLDTPADL